MKIEIRKPERHGMTNTKLYRVWAAMCTRCYTNTYIDRHRYKDRGISMCDEWKCSFVAFKDWALQNGYVHGLQLDRRDNDKGYTPDNCRFVTPTENSNNKSVTVHINYRGRTMPLKPLLREIGLLHRYNTIYYRIKHGWSPEKAIEAPNTIGRQKQTDSKC